jgi:RES domain-containing protein
VSLRVEPWRGTTFRHVPNGASPLDTTRAGLARGRWNLPGEPTQYLASSREAAAAEWLRHLEAAGLAAGDPVPPRDLYEVKVRLQRTIDFRDEANQAQLSIADMARLVLDPVAARALATFVRSALDAEAIWVPSIAFLDRRDQGNLVIFLERLHGPLADLATARLVGQLTLP